MNEDTSNKETIINEDKSNNIVRIILLVAPIYIIIELVFYSVTAPLLINYPLIVHGFAIIILLPSLITIKQLKYYIKSIMKKNDSLIIEYYVWNKLYTVEYNIDKFRVDLKQLDYVRGKAYKLIISIPEKKINIQQGERRMLELSGWNQNVLLDVYNKLKSLSINT